MANPHSVDGAEPRQNAACVDDVLITDELARRGQRPPDYAAEARALEQLAQEMATNPSGVLQKVADLTMELTRADSAVISILEGEDEDGVFRWHATAGKFAPNLNWTMPRKASPCCTALARNKVLLFNEAERFFPALRGVQPRIYENLLVPWHADGKPVGTLWAIGHTAEHRFDAEDARILHELSRFAAAAWRLVQARERAELSLSDDASIRREGDLRITTAELQRRIAIAERSGADVDEARRAAANVLEDSLDAQRRAEQLNRELEQEIAERKRAEEGLHTGERRYRILFDSVPVAVYSTDAEGVIQEFNRRAVELWGRAPGKKEKFCGSFKLFYGDGRPMAREECPMARVLRGEELAPSDCEITIEHEDGTRNDVIVRPTVLRNAQGEISGAINCLHDISERKGAEERLRSTEERFRQFAENSADLFWIVNAHTRGIEYVNPIYERMWGESREAVIGDINRWSELVHPADRQKAAAVTMRLLAGETVTVEYRIVRPNDRAVRWIRDTGFPIPDAKGKIQRIAGVAQDITDERRRAEALRESEERYRLLVDGARDYAIFMMNPSNEIVYWSAGAERVFGWSAEEAVGESGELVFTPEDRAVEQEEKEIETALREGCASDRRWHIRKDGTRIWVDGVMRRLDDEQTGALRGFAKVARDASEQRKAEEDLRKAHRDLEKRVRERTAELQDRNQQLHQEMQRRQMLEKDILRITERERARISEDLHDSLCQELTATAFLLKSRAKAIAPQSKAASDSLIEAAATVNANAGFARDLARGLHPFELGSAGLPSALRELCSRTAESINCRCDCPRSLRLDENVAVNLFRIAQEAVTNSVKHAKANEIVISLERTNGEIVLTVSDDGEGKRVRGRGLGMNIMKYRASAAGGTLDVDSARGRGTTVTCRVPVKH
jgi:PAS domain S-box-containing protein